MLATLYGILAQNAPAAPGATNGTGSGISVSWIVIAIVAVIVIALLVSMFRRGGRRFGGGGMRASMGPRYGRRRGFGRRRFRNQRAA